MSNKLSLVPISISFLRCPYIILLSSLENVTSMVFMLVVCMLFIHFNMHLNALEFI